MLPEKPPILPNGFDASHDNVNHSISSLILSLILPFHVITSHHTEKTEAGLEVFIRETTIAYDLYFANGQNNYIVILAIIQTLHLVHPSFTHISSFHLLCSIPNPFPPSLPMPSSLSFLSLIPIGNLPMLLSKPRMADALQVRGISRQAFCRYKLLCTLSECILLFLQQPPVTT